MSLQRTERHIIKNDPNINKLCFLSKNLYNYANYLIRQEYIKNKKWLRYQKLDKLLQKEECYIILPNACSQQILKLLDKNWSDFFKIVKDYKKNPNKYRSRPKPPRYKDKIKGRNIVIFTAQNQISLKNNFIHFPKKANLKPLKTKVTKIQQVRIVPQATCYVIEVIYKKEKINVETIPNTYLSIDLGLNNLATCVNNIGLRPFIINGKIPKSFNQYYNKKRSILQSYIGSKGFSNRIKKLTLKRNNKVNDYFHKASRYIINFCIKNKISTIIIGHNKDWKQSIELGKRNNQNFVDLPFVKLIRQLQYKGEEVGINVIVREESYTSKCSFLDLEEIGKKETYLGKRIKRGLFRSSRGKLVNADINGAYNILRKEIPNVFDNGIEGVALHPLKISNFGDFHKESINLKSFKRLIT